MKKFLCYDTNDAASGKIEVDNRGMLKPNSTVPSGSTPYQQLVTDGVGNTKWEDRLAYEGGSRLVIDSGHDVQYVKVSDEVPSWVSVDASMKVWGSDGTNSTTNPEQYIDLGNGSFMNQTALFITTDNFEFSGSGGSFVFPEKGVYFLSMPDVAYTSGIGSADSDTPEITWDGNIGVVKKLDEKFIPVIPAEKLPVIPAEKLPDIPAHVIEVNEGFFDSIENASQPSYTVNNLSYSEILSIFNSKNFVIKDNAAYYRPINFSISTDGNLFVQILVNRINISGNMVVAGLACNNGNSRFYRNNYWTIAGTKKS